MCYYNIWGNVRKLLDFCREAWGDNVGALLRGVDRDGIERGQVLAKPGTIKPHTKLKASDLCINNWWRWTS